MIQMSTSLALPLTALGECVSSQGFLAILSFKLADERQMRWSTEYKWHGNWTYCFSFPTVADNVLAKHRIQSGLYFVGLCLVITVQWTIIINSTMCSRSAARLRLAR